MLKDWIRTSASQRTELYLSLGTLTCAILLFLSNPQGTFPIDYGDETTYLEGARAGGITLEWSPPYAAWYRLLSTLAPDPINLFYTNFILITAALPFLVFAFLIRLKVRPYIALLGAAWMLLWAFNAGTSVKVNHFNLILLLLGSFAADKFGDTLERKILLFGLLSLFLTYIRQENLFIACLSFQTVLGLYCMRPQKPDRFLLACMLIAGVGVVLLAKLSPFDRGWDAFSDHYYSLYEQHASPERPLDPQNTLIVSTFPGAGSTFEALKVNPAAVLRAFGTRLSDITMRLIPITTYHFTVLSPNDRLNSTISYLECCLALLALVLVFISRRGNLTAFLQKHHFLTAILLLLAGKLVVSCLLVNPVIRYVMDFIVVLVVFVIALLTSEWRKEIPFVAALPALLVFLILMPRSGQFVLNDIIVPHENRKFHEARAAIEHIKEENRRRGLERPRYFAGNIFPVYASLHNAEYRNHWLLLSVLSASGNDSYKKKFALALDSAEIDIVVVDEKLLYEIAIGYKRLLEPVVRNFPDFKGCFEVTMKNSFATVLYRKSGCRANAAP